MKGVQLPILYHTTETSKFKEIGIDFSLDDCYTKNAIVYPHAISMICEYIDKDGKPYTEIIVHGESYLIDMNIEELETLLINN